MRARFTATFVVLGSWASAAVLLAASPPELVNYQGVLRNATGQPLTGNYEMVFRLYDAATAGNEILKDEHLVPGTGAVGVNGGLFSVQIGSGQVSDGAGPGTFTALSQVFQGFSAVYLDVQVGGEFLLPRTRLASAPYALNVKSVSSCPVDPAADQTVTANTPSSLICVYHQSLPGKNWSDAAASCYASGGAHLCSYDEMRRAQFAGSFFMSANSWLRDRTGNDLALVVNGSNANNFDGEIDVGSVLSGRYCCLEFPK